MPATAKLDGSGEANGGSVALADNCVRLLFSRAVNDKSKVLPLASCFKPALVPV